MGWRDCPVTVSAVNLIELAQMHDMHARTCPIADVKRHREAAIRCRSDARELARNQKLTTSTTS